MSDWGTGVLERYGASCVACGHSCVELDHIWPRSQGRKNPRVKDVKNGIPLCSDFCLVCEMLGVRPCHKRKTYGELKFRIEWLKLDTIVFLADVGWVAWDGFGQPYGPGMRHFEPLPARWMTDEVIRAMPVLVR